MANKTIKSKISTKPVITQSKPRKEYVIFNYKNLYKDIVYEHYVNSTKSNVGNLIGYIDFMDKIISRKVQLV